MANLKKKMKAVIGDNPEPVAVESQAAFCKRHKGLSLPALRYARDHDKIDVWKEGNTVLVILTEKTMAYKPNPHPGRRVRKPAK